MSGIESGNFYSNSMKEERFVLICNSLKIQLYMYIYMYHQLLKLKTSVATLDFLPNQCYFQFLKLKIIPWKIKISN